MTSTTEPAPASEPTPSTAATLIDALLADGEAVDEGGFSFDAAAAAAKLDAFQFADRSAYLVPIAEAAAGLDAQEVRIETLGEDLVITIQAVTLADPRRFLADPWARTRADSSSRRGRAWARLGVGLSMAVGHDSIERVLVSYSTDDETLTAEYRHGQPPRLARVPLECPRELRIIVDRPWTDRLSLRGAAHAELAQLRAAVAHASTEFTLDGHRISKRARDWPLGEFGQGSGPGYRWSAGLAKGDGPGRIELRVEQIRVGTLAAERPGFVAVLDLDAPTRDLSQLEIVHDAAVSQALAEIERVRAEGIANRPPAESFEDRLGRGVKKTGVSMFGLAFLGGGTLAGAIGVGMVARGDDWGFFPLIFLFTHGGSGATSIASALIEDDARARKRLIILLVTLAGIVALALGWFGASLFV